MHGEDIRRPLGTKGDHARRAPHDARRALQEDRRAAAAKKRVAGPEARATDVDWSTGEGPEVRGPCMSLIMAMVGRERALDDCDGEGVDTMRARC